MNISSEKLRALLGLLGITEPEELNCEEFLSMTPGYLEELRDHEGPAIEGYRSFLHHLKICPECSEEFQALIEAMDKGIL